VAGAQRHRRQTESFPRAFCLLFQPRLGKIHTEYIPNYNPYIVSCARKTMLYKHGLQRASLPSASNLTRLRLSLRQCPSHSRSSAFATRPGGDSRVRANPTVKWNHYTQIRGAKSRSTINLSDIPQGAIDMDFLEPLEDIDEDPDYPPVIQQVRNNMIKFSHCVLLTRVGGFYEV